MENKSKRYLMALDAGTGSVRAVIFDLDGHQIGSAQKEWTHLADPHIPGSMNFDLDTNWNLASECIKQAIQNAKIDAVQIMSISTCSMREGIVLYDKRQRPIWACGNVDARAVEEVKKLKMLNDRTFEKAVYDISGQTLALSAIPRLLWLSEHEPTLYAQVHAISMISDWLAFMLSGELAVEPSNAGTTGILNLQTRNWQPDLLEAVGLKSDILTPVKETGTLLGKVRSEVAAATGLSPETRVVVGGGDVQLGCVGLGITEASQAAIIGGTFWQQVVNLPVAKTDPEMNIRVNPHVIPPLVQAESISFFTGLTMRWFRDAFCEAEKHLAEQLGIDTYTLLEQMAARVPVGSNDIVPVFSDAMHFKSWYHASPSFINLSLDSAKCNKAALFRALEENAAIVSSCNLDQVEKFSGVKLTSVVFAGGGSKGHLWSQILADVTGLTVNIPVVKEATALGCAIAAGVGVGIYPSLSAAGKKLVKFERQHQPDAQNHAVYQAHKKKWIEIYHQQLLLVDSELTTSLWKAPGL
ncbi:autoinducer 2 (AI-2) kinase [Pasteurella testudinis DSM 23072]|uniref:Autoinducer 2 (AI-2) kinase n=1 Tax=Pasteurella testudinis DSM 23072 TaxID=1122938 RepID=A0A1W1UC46_9PAST|nr:autoinducer-2 kinase [Pasteurella testudinis]SMB78381.1 autoinducer 2 (AI-2) kinase [Pasteurella testudinis DSM 23072]SUB52608.1 autoinducer 2 kinase lsrK [Pasteurella testudinis]